MIRFPHDGSLRSRNDLARDGSTFVDGPQRVMPFDIENLDCAKIDEDFVARRDYARVPEIIRAALERAQQHASPALSELIDEMLATKFLVHLSSTYGMRDNPAEVRAHIEFVLRKLLTLEQMARIAAALNEALIAARLICEGGKHIIDQNLYSPAHLLFTAPVLKCLVDGVSGDRTYELPDFYLADRVLVWGTHNHAADALDVSDELLAERAKLTTATSKRAMVAFNDNVAIVGTKQTKYPKAVDRAALVKEVRPGNTDAPKSRLIASIAAGPVSHAYSELRHYHEIFVERIKATSNSEKQLAQRREDHGQFEDWLEQYEREASQRSEGSLRHCYHSGRRTAASAVDLHGAARSWRRRYGPRCRAHSNA